MISERRLDCMLLCFRPNLEIPHTREDGMPMSYAFSVRYL